MKTLTTQIESHSQIRHSFYLRFLIVTTFALVFLMIGWPQAASAAVENNARQHDAKDDDHGLPKATATPTPIDCSNPNPPIKVIENPGQYELVGPCAVGVSLAIQASDVDLDLNGFTISGPFSDSSACSGIDSFGISFNGHSNVHIHNGEVTGFNLGILFNTAHDNKVNDVTVRRNCFGILVLGSNNNHINENNVSENFHSGVTFISSSNDNALVSNEVNNNGGGDGAGNPGVFIDHSDRNLIAFNHISDTKISTMESRNQGMRLVDAHFSLIFGNTVNGSAGEGIRIDGVVGPNPASTANVVLFNRATGNAPSNSFRWDLADYNLISPPPPPPCVNLNLWKFNRFVTDNEEDGPGLGCIQ